LFEKDVVATGLLKKMKNVRFGTRVHFAISFWTLTSVAVLFGESSKNFQRYRNMSDVLATNLQSLFE
jgi:hypothetical protein